MLLSLRPIEAPTRVMGCNIPIHSSDSIRRALFHACLMRLMSGVPLDASVRFYVSDGRQWIVTW